MIKIKASDGQWLTQLVLTYEHTRTFAATIFTPTPELWIEWTDKQKMEWEEANPQLEPPIPQAYNQPISEQPTLEERVTDIENVTAEVIIALNEKGIVP